AFPPDRVERWMRHRAEQLGLALAPEAGELLLASVGNDLSGLARELEKLAPLCAGRPATPAEVAALVGARRGETLQDFVDAALERRAAAAARLVEAVLEQAGMNGVRILSARAADRARRAPAGRRARHGPRPARGPVPAGFPGSRRALHRGPQRGRRGAGGDEPAARRGRVRTVGLRRLGARAARPALLRPRRSCGHGA